MTGQELYAFYVEAFRALNNTVDPWEDLDDLEREAWQLIADHMNIEQQAQITAAIRELQGRRP